MPVRPVPVHECTPRPSMILGGPPWAVALTDESTVPLPASLREDAYADVVTRPAASSESVRARMSRQKRRDTKPEVAIRRELHRRGLRYRVERIVLPRRKADIVFGPAKVAVFVHGCFWHSCPQHGTMPKANADWWAAKLARNVERDRETREALQAQGWQVMEVWEHEPPLAAADLIELVVGRRRRRAEAVSS